MAVNPNSDFGQFVLAKEFFDYSAYDMIQPGTINPVSMVTQNDSNKMEIPDYLVAFSTQPQSFCVGCVDMVNSTKMAASIPSRKLSGFYEVFLNSMAKIIGKYSGKVIKNIGDCLLYYFPNQDSKKGFQNCLNCGIAMIAAQSIICEKLKSKELPCLSYRISADFGNVMVMNTTDSPSLDMIGPPVNMCTKINHCAKNNEFVVGGDFYQTAKNLKRYQFIPVESCNIGFKVSYPVYRVMTL